MLKILVRRPCSAHPHRETFQPRYTYLVCNSIASLTPDRFNSTRRLKLDTNRTRTRRWFLTAHMHSVDPNLARPSTARERSLANRELSQDKWVSWFLVRAVQHLPAHSLLHFCLYCGALLDAFKCA